MLMQDYSLYTDTDQQTWSFLYQRQLKAVQQHAYRYFPEALALLGFSEKKIPGFPELNNRLADLTGWSIYAVPGLIDNAYFFEQMNEQRFGATTWLRKPEQMDYLEEPDMFHDVFGHVPLLADPRVCNYLSALAGAAQRFSFNEDVVEAIARLYWYTIEFGLIKEKEQLKIYGAGILSSISETQYCLSGKPRLEPFDVEQVIATPYIKDSFQEQYFVIEDFAELAAGVKQLEHIFSTAL